MARYDGTNTTIEFGDTDGGASTVWTAVGQVEEIGSGPGGGTTDEIDVTDRDSPGNFRQLLQGLKDSGSMDFVVNYDPALASHAAAAGLAQLYADGDNRDWRLTLPDVGGSQITFEGYVQQFQVVPQFNNRLLANVSLRINGAVTFP